YRAGRLNIRQQRIGLDLTLRSEHPAHDGSYQHGLCTDRPRLIDIADQVRAIGSLRVRLALRAFAGTIVVSKLNQHVIRLGSESRRPGAFITKAFGTPAVEREIEHFHFRTERSPKTGSPSALIVHCGVPHQYYLDASKRRAGHTKCKGEPDVSHTR